MWSEGVAQNTTEQKRFGQEKKRFNASSHLKTAKRASLTKLPFQVLSTVSFHFLHSSCREQWKTALLDALLHSAEVFWWHHLHASHFIASRVSFKLNRSDINATVLYTMNLYRTDNINAAIVRHTTNLSVNSSLSGKHHDTYPFSLQVAGLFVILSTALNLRHVNGLATCQPVILGVSCLGHPENLESENLETEKLCRTCQSQAVETLISICHDASL